MRSSISDCLLSGSLLVLVLQTTDVLACATCTGATPEPVRQAYSYSTAWLSFVPLIFLGSVAFTIYRIVKRGQTEEKQ